MSREDFIVADSQFRLAAVARVILDKLPANIEQTLKTGFVKKYEEPSIFEHLPMLANHVSIPIFKISLAISEIILAITSFISQTPNNQGLLSDEKLKVVNDAGNGIKEIPARYFISRAASHAHIDMEIAKTIWDILWDFLKNNDINVEGFRCRQVSLTEWRIECSNNEFLEEVER